MSYQITSQVFELTGSGLKPITTNDLEIGQKVIHAHHDGVAVVTGKSQMGYTITFENGRQHHGQTIGALSPYTRIEPVEPLEIVSSDTVSDLLFKADMYKIAMKEKQEAEARQHAADVTRITAELRQKYPWAVSGDGLTCHARAAKNLREELKRTFPGVKFSVRSDSFSGGNSVDVHWDFGPTSKQVEEVALKYKNSDFDGMTDSQVYDHSAYGRAVSAVLGRVTFVSCRRNDAPREFMERIERGICLIQQREYAGPDTEVMDSGYYYKDQVSYVARELFSLTAFPIRMPDFTIESDQSDERAHWARIAFVAATEPEATPVTVSADGVTVTENEEKNGVEIRFNAKPSEEIRAALKSSGFRWSKFQGLWYARRSPETLAFARSLAAE